MMSMVLDVEKILNDKHNSRAERLLAIQKRYDELLERGLIAEIEPKTFGPNVSTGPGDLSNKHINYTLND
jgi:hypothetical protein